MRICNAQRGVTMSGSKGQDQGADIDELIKDAGKVLDSWKKAIDDIAKDLAKLRDGKGAKGGNADKGDKGDKSGKGGDSKKRQEQAQKDEDDASNKLSED